MNTDDRNNNGIILFDGVCNLCESSVQFVLRHDPKSYFKFASLQSEVGSTIAKSNGIPASKHLNSMILIDKGKVFRESSAALHILKHLGMPWSISYVLIIIPPPLRNMIYRWVGRNRYHWFGKKESCALPPANFDDRFLD